MYFHFLCSYDNLRRCICVDGIKDVQKEEFVKFEWNDQPLNRHNEMVQQKIIKLGVRRTRKVMIELNGTDLAQYYDGTNFVFNGKVLSTPENCIEQMAKKLANKQIGVIKRRNTMANRKASNINDETEMDRLKSIQKKINDRAAELVAEYERSILVPNIPPSQQQRNVIANPQVG